MKNWMELILRGPADKAGGGGETTVESVLGGDPPAGNTPADPPAGNTPADPPAGDKPADPPAGEKPADPPAGEKPADPPAGQTPEEKAAAEAAAEAEAKLAEVPPEGEAYEFQLPEDVELDAELAEQAQPVLRELGLTRAAANKLAEFMSRYRSATADKIVNDYVTAQKQYVETARADPEIGGQNWDTSVAQANQALQKFGTPGLVAALREHGLANHPEMIRFAKRIGLHTADDVPEKGDHVDTTEVPPEARWYGDTTATTKRG